jgi:hypothetical protein
VAEHNDQTISATPETIATGTPTAQQRPPRPQVQIDDRNAHVAYANFCRVTGTPEELILDFGLNPQPFGVPTEPIPVNHRLIVNFYTAKRMLQALHLTIQRQEAAFGVLETDVQKRVMPGAFRQTPPTPRTPSPAEA